MAKVKFQPLELTHKTYGECFVVRPSDAVLLDSGRALRVQSAPKRLPRDGWRRTFRLDSFEGDPRVLHEIHRRLYEMWEVQRRRALR